MSSASPSTQPVHPAVLHAMLQARVDELAAGKAERKSARARPARRGGRGAIATFAALSLLLVSALTALAVHDLGLFELDENALDGLAAGDDWDDVFNGTDSAAASVFVQDGDDFSGGIDVPAGLPSNDTTYFTTGGSKDVNDINQWMHQTGDVAPDKDEILNAYAAAYLGPDGDDAGTDPDLILYFGLDRLANNGDAQVGFWFFQSIHSLNADGTFSGVHQVGDILVLSHFTNGGVVDTIEVYEWVGPPDPDNLALVATGVECGPADDDVCAAVNDSTETAPWPYVAKSPEQGESENDFAPGSFYEGGLNASAFGLDIGCGGTFLAETRSSQSLDAQLKDFALGDFALCDIEVDKTGDELSKVGDPVDYTITIENTGVVTVFKDDISDTVFGNLVVNGVNQADPNAWTDFNFATADPCGASLAAGADCTIEVTRTVQEGDDDPLPNTVTATYNANVALTGSAVADSDDHEVELFQPSVEITKDGTTASKEGDDVTYDYTIENTSSTDSPDLILDTLVDTGDNNGGLGLGDLTALTGYDTDCDELAPGDICTFSITYTVLAGDDDPLNNTVTAHYHPDGFTNDITDSDDHEVELFQPSVEITKDGTTASKEGDDVTYDYTIENTSSTDSPDLILDTLVDTGDNNGGLGLGDLTALTGYDTDCDELAPGDICTFSITYTVLAGDDDPLNNTVTAHYHPDGFTNDITDSDDHEVELFQPSVTVDKSGTEVSKVGDTVTYTYLITNTSSLDSPNLILDSIIDTGDNNGGAGLGDLTLLAGYDTDCDELASGESCTFDIDYIVLAGDDDPLNNEVDVDYHPDGFENNISDQDDHEVALFQPSVTVDKSGTEVSKVGDDITYTYTITNTSSADSPNLILDSINDTGDNNGGAGLGDLTAYATYNADCDELASGEFCTFDIVYTVLAGDDDPLNNEVDVDYHPLGLTNNISHQDTHEVELFQPLVEVIKGGPTEATVGDLITYTFTINNTSSLDSPDLILVSVTDTVLGDLTATASAGGCGTLAPAGSCNFTFDYTILATDPTPLVNVVTVLYNPEGFPNEVTDDDDHSLEIVPGGEGCTPGFWKTHTDLWDGVGEDLSPTFDPDTLFDDVFGAGADTQAGLRDGATLLDALNVNGGAKKAVARHGAAAVLNADSGINFPYDVATVIDIVQDGIDYPGGDPDGFTVQQALTALVTANEAGCPFGENTASVPSSLSLAGFDLVSAVLFASTVGASRLRRRPASMS